MSALLKACREDIQATKKAIATLEEKLEPLQRELAGLEAIEDQLLKGQLGVAPPRRKAGKPAKAGARRKAKEGEERRPPSGGKRAAKRAEYLERLQALLAKQPALSAAQTAKELGCSWNLAKELLGQLRKAA